MNPEFRSNLLKNLLKDILGQDNTKLQLKSALLAERHLIVVGPPGVGKTTLAKNIASLLPEILVNDCEYNCDPKSPHCPECLSSKSKPKTKKVSGMERFVRIQGSPDLTSEDLLGDIDPSKALQFGPLSIEAFTPGKIFRANNGILFFDEVNRCPERLQNSLLQVLEEGKATLGSYTIEFPADFIFIGTMNPEDSSTEKLSDVFMDRCDVVEMSYPETEAIEFDIVKEKSLDIDIKFPDNLLHLVTLFIRSLRTHKDVEKKPSVRATIGVYERSKTFALLHNRKEVIANDILAVIVSVLAHRFTLKPSIRYLQSPEQFVREQYSQFSAEHAELKERGGRL